MENKDNQKIKYICEICETKKEQMSHHRKHMLTEKHQDKRKIFELELKNLNETELYNKYSTCDIEKILRKKEYVIWKKIKIITPKNNLSDNSQRQYEEQFVKIQMENTKVGSNRELLKSMVHDYHNFCRNNGVGYGFKALYVFNLFYNLMKLEVMNCFELSGLEDNCKFSNLLKMASSQNTMDHERLLRTVVSYKPDNEGTESVLTQLSKNEKMREIMFTEIPKKINVEVFAELIRKIEQIRHVENNCDVQLSGHVYEYFIGRNIKDISDLGAYFTNRYITNCIFEQHLQIELDEEGNIPSMIDPFGGSGGLTNRFVMECDRVFDVNWKDNINRIYHYDMNGDVVKLAGSELFYLTKQFPDTVHNVIETNSFKNEFLGRKFKYVLSNPPYGGDKTKNEEIIQCETIDKRLKELLIEHKNDAVLIEKYSKMKANNLIRKKNIQRTIDKHIVCVNNASNRIHEYANAHNLGGKDKESTSMILFMDLIDKNGTCCIVMKEGVLFNSIYSNIRRHLLTHFDVEKIISIPSDQFENTTTKTSIIIFHNTKPTEHVDFYELTVDKYTEDVFEEYGDVLFLEHNKDDVMYVNSTFLKRVNVVKILEQKHATLDHKFYNGENGFDNVPRLIPKQGFKMVKLGDYFNILNGYSFKSSEYINDIDISEKIPIITIKNLSNMDLNTCNHVIKNDKYQRFMLSKNNMIVSLTGNIKSIAKICFYPHNEGYLNQRVAKIINKSNISLLYLYHIWNIIKQQLCNAGNGSIQFNISSTHIENSYIPVPESDEYLTQITNILETHKEIVFDKNLEYNKLNQVKEYITKCDAFLRQRVKHISENEECESMKIKDVCDIKNGTRIVKVDMVTQTYPVYGGGGISFYTDKYNRNGQTCKISREGMSMGNCVMLIYGKYYLNSQGLTIDTKDCSYKYYVWYYLMINKDKVYKCENGSAQKAIKMDQLLNIQLLIPKNKQLISDLQQYFDKLEKSHTFKVQLENEYEKLKWLSDNSCEYQ